MIHVVFRFIKRGVGLALVGSSLLPLAGCSDDDGPARIDGIWLNSASAPNIQVECAYPKQVLRLEGAGFSRLTELYVNDTPVSTDGSYIYATDAAYTFTVPSDVHISEDYDVFSLRVVTPDGETVYTPFLVKPTSQKPSITRSSSTMLVAGQSLTFTGKNLTGACEVWLPTAFDGRVSCPLDPATPATATTVTVLVPEGETYVSGQAEIVMEKTEYVSTPKGRTYRESVFSSTIDFSN